MAVLILFLSLPAVIAPEARAVPIFRFPDGRFSSGDLSESELKPTGATQHSYWLKISSQTSKHPLWVKRENVLSALDLSTRALVTAKAVLFKHPWSQKVSREIDESTVVELQGQTAGDRAEIKLGRRTFWINEDRLAPDQREFGLALTKLSTPMREKPEPDSPVILTINDGRKLKPTRVDGSWALVKYKEKSGWISLHKVISKLDFAKTIRLRSDGPAFDVESVSGGWVTLKEHNPVLLEQVSQIETRDDLLLATDSTRARTGPGLSGTSIAETYGLGQPLTLLDRVSVDWIESLNDDGERVWHRRSPEPSDSDEMDYVTLDELGARGITSATSLPDHDQIQVVSAAGVYKTLNGRDWQRIEFFGDENYPVAFAPNGDLFVGLYKSTDRGETFKPYLRWDRVLSRITTLKGHVPENLRLVGIAFEGDDLIVTLSYGRKSLPKTIRLATRDSGLHWKSANDQTLPRLSHGLGLEVPAGAQKPQASRAARYERALQDEGRSKR